MVIGTGRITLYLPENYSLKDKRHNIRSLLAQIVNTFRVSAAEVGELDNWTRSILGIAVVSNDTRHANEVISKVVSFVESHLPEGGVEDYEVEMVHMG
jgi:uncharacterized protein YlxP (DUF503 family)